MKRYELVEADGDPLFAPCADGDMVFYSDVAEMVAMNKELVANLEYFVHRVDAGTARSTTTYNKFKATLAKAKELNQ